MKLGGKLAVGLVAAAGLYAQRYGSGPSWWSAGQGGYLGWDQSFDNADGQIGVLNKKGSLRTDGHPFFEPQGRNGRACITCHQPASAMSVSAASLRQRWEESGGKDPVFAAIDGSNCPDLPQEKASSHSLLMDRGLFRIALAWPPKQVEPDFRLDVVRDPAGCNAQPGVISVYRRPRMAANLDRVIPGPAGIHFMADGREASLESQAISAILIHEQAPAHPSVETLRQIVAFETQVYAAQSADIRGGLLTERDGPAALGPENLASGKPAALGTQLSFDMWRQPRGAGLQYDFRASVARGSDVFFERKFSGQTCAGCHASGTTRWMDIGTANRTEAEALPDLPLFRATCETTGRVIYTQDPGRALISGKCADVGKLVLQQLRGLAARAPYFANGSARTLAEVVDFYDRRYGIHLSAQERTDLVNFLRVL